MVQVLTRTLKRPSPIEFPDYIRVSCNNFNPSWSFSLKTYRRLKNVVCFMEWIPEMKNLKPSKDKCEVTPDHLKLLNKAFKLFDGNADGRLEIDELKQMVWTMGYHETRGEIDDMIARVNKSSFDFQEVVDVLQSQQYIGIEDDDTLLRYLSLRLKLFEQFYTTVVRSIASIVSHFEFRATT